MEWLLDENNKWHQILIYILGILFAIFIISLPVFYIYYVRTNRFSQPAYSPREVQRHCSSDYMGGIICD